MNQPAMRDLPAGTPMVLKESRFRALASVLLWTPVLGLMWFYFGGALQANPLVLVATVLLAVGVLASLYAFLRPGAIVADARGVSVRMWRTRRIAWADVRDIQVVQTRSGLFVEIARRGSDPSPAIALDSRWGVDPRRLAAALNAARAKWG